MYSSTFKGDSGPDEVATWKDMPQDSRSIIDWYQRLHDIFGAEGDNPEQPWRESLIGLSADQLRALGTKYGAQYVIVQKLAGTSPPNLEEVYGNRSFAV